MFGDRHHLAILILPHPYQKLFMIFGFQNKYISIGQITGNNVQHNATISLGSNGDNHP